MCILQVNEARIAGTTSWGSRQPLGVDPGETEDVSEGRRQVSSRSSDYSGMSNRSTHLVLDPSGIRVSVSGRSKVNRDLPSTGLRARPWYVPVQTDERRSQRDVRTRTRTVSKYLTLPDT